MSKTSYEEEYIANLININKSLRDQLELLYSLLRKKLRMDGPNERVEALLSELEIVHSNLCNEMKNQMNITKIIKSVDLAVLSGKQLEEQESVNNNLQIQIDSLTSENLLLKSKNDLLEQENLDLKKKCEIALKENAQCLKKEENAIKELENIKKEKDTIEQEKNNANVKLKENEDTCMNMMNQIENLSSKLKEVENKFKSKLVQKDLIITKLDESLQNYEKELFEKTTEISKIKKLNKENLLNEMIKTSTQRNSTQYFNEEESDSNDPEKNISKNSI